MPITVYPHRPILGPPDPEKLCIRCGEVRPRSEYFVDFTYEGGLADGPCLTCRNVNAYRKTPEARRAWRRSMLRRKYGPDAPEVFDALMLEQGGCCAICLEPSKVVERRGGNIEHLAVDHDSTTGKIRGLLCGRCNRLLGNLGDNQAGVLRFLEYLREPPVERLSKSCTTGARAG